MMSNDGLIIENMDLSHIHLAVNLGPTFIPECRVDKKFTYQQLVNSTSSPPMCRYLSGNVLTISSKKASRKVKVDLKVGSMGP